MELRLRFILLVLMALLAAAVWTFPAWRLYLRQPGENEAFPGLEIELQRDFLALSAAKRAALLAEQARDPALALEMVLAELGADESAPPDDDISSELAAARRLVSGEFHDFDALRWGDGQAAIYELADARRILRFENFTAARCQEGRVYLARDPLPGSEAELGPEPRDLGRLKGNVGDQSYFLPVDLDLSLYMSAAILCRQFDTMLTVATLR